MIIRIRVGCLYKQEANLKDTGPELPTYLLNGLL